MSSRVTTLPSLRLFACVRVFICLTVQCSSEISTDDLEGKTSDVHAAITAARAEQEVRDAMGAEIVLVPTFKHVDEWQPVASRQLPNVKWQWEG